MIKHFSENALLLSATVLFTGLASATNTVEVSTGKVINTTKTYTAHGSMNKKTALMIKYLLRNPHLRVEAYAGRPTSQINRQVNRSANINVSYTIKGKTDRKTALRLKKLFQNNKHISITANINYQPTKNPTLASNVVKPTYTTYFSEYTPFYYKGVPPVYTKGNMLMYPVRINERQIASKKDDTISVYKEKTIVASR